MMTNVLTLTTMRYFLDVYELLNLLKRFIIFQNKLSKRLEFNYDIFVSFVWLTPSPLLYVDIFVYVTSFRHLFLNFKPGFPYVQHGSALARAETVKNSGRLGPVICIVFV